MNQFNFLEILLQIFCFRKYQIFSCEHFNTHMYTFTGTFTKIENFLFSWKSYKKNFEKQIIDQRWILELVQKGLEIFLKLCVTCA